ncbi:(2Fe-2S)-binding protein [Rhodopseudomonas palustris]|uniref:2Fe-2S iron-sulfur cluster-binding protein n=1 Tax=Rhodopseudomonas palustris TaxID=1076 RepID=UPI0020CF8BEE|nr:2Fe-2S iron-sulfur cluster-binding protein [Rhodopseudomonas palustris]MCP9626089.1 (2Fe-2S)-binding protein [Rhodopseudomonas palustris]
MPTITFILPDGRREVADAAVGDTAMYAALSLGLDGIVAECGGNAVCATCHVYVEEGLSKLPPVDGNEDDLLDGAAAERLPSSRLSCQIKLTDDLDGLVVRIPERQF